MERKAVGRTGVARLKRPASKERCGRQRGWINRALVVRDGGADGARIPVRIRVMVPSRLKDEGALREERKPRGQEQQPALKARTVHSVNPRR